MDDPFASVRLTRFKLCESCSGTLKPDEELILCKECKDITDTEKALKAFHKYYNGD